MPDVLDHAPAGAGEPVDLSILIVTYHSAETITACVQSLLDDPVTLKKEIIVVDNASRDGSVVLLEGLAESHPELVLICNTHNKGFAAGNNQALKKSSGKHVLILNPDTIVHPGAIQGLWDALEGNDAIAMTAPRMQYPDGRLQKTCRRFPTHGDVIYNSLGLAQLWPSSKTFNAWKMGDFDHQSARQVDQPAGAGMLVRGSVLRELGGFDENFPMFFNDVDLCKRIKDRGYEIWFLPQFIVDHVGGASVNRKKVKMTVSSHVSFFRYFEKHFTRIHQQPMNFLVGILLYLSLLPRLLFLMLSRDGSSHTRDTL